MAVDHFAGDLCAADDPQSAEVARRAFRQTERCRERPAGVLVRDVPADVVAVGDPARVVRAV